MSTETNAAGGARLLAERIRSPHAFYGRVLFVMFRTDADLAQWIPYPLEPADRHRAFLKIYQLKMRPLDGEPLPPGLSQYTQVCVTTLAAPPGHPLEHYNLMLWEGRDWSLGGAEPYGWRKKLGEIEMTWTFPHQGRYDRDPIDLYATDIHQNGLSILAVRAHLDGSPGVDDPGISGGFYSVRYRSDGSPAEGSATAEVWQIDVDDVFLGEPVRGRATARFFAPQNYSAEDAELLEALGEVDVEGCTLRDVGWVRRRFPPRLIVTDTRAPVAGDQVG